MNRRDLLLVVVTSIATTFATTALFLGAQAFADGQPSTDGVPRQIPYRGTLEKDGEPVSGTVSMTFSLFDGLADTEADWSETQLVTVYAGEFSVLLGASSAMAAATLEAVVANADDLYLSVALQTGDGVSVPLSNRQRFLPVPFALWTPNATNLVIEGDDNTGEVAALVVRDPAGNSLLVDGDEVESSKALLVNKVGKSPVQFGGAIEVDGTSSFTGFTQLSDAAVSGALLADGELAVAGPLTAVDATLTGDLTVGGAIAGLDGAATFAGDVLVPGALEVDGAAKLDGGLAVTGASSLTGNVTVTGSATVSGAAKVSGLLDIGLDYKTCDAGYCACDGNKRIMGGGASCASGSLKTSERRGPITSGGIPLFNEGWWASCTSGTPSITIVCARLK